jgi:predicted nucleic acid-binding protein
MAPSVLLDAGPLVAYLRQKEEHHKWAVEQFRRFTRFTTCEAVLAEACARLAYYNEEPARVLELVRDAGPDMVVEFAAKAHADRVARLMRKYTDQPMDFADACLVVMSEQARNCAVLTLDAGDFRIYRRHDREVIPFLSPAQEC